MSTQRVSSLNEIFYDDTLQYLGSLHESLTFLCFNKNTISGEDLVPVKCI